MRFERTTSSLQGKLSPIEIQTLIWWARLVSIQLLPKETGLQPAAVADLLLTHIMFTLFKILCELNYEMFTFRRTHGYIVYQSDYRAVIRIELSHTCSLARIGGFEPPQAFTPLRVFKTHLFNHLSISAYLIGASVRWKHLYLRSCTEVPPITGYVIFIVPQLHQMPFTSDSSYMEQARDPDTPSPVWKTGILTFVLRLHIKLNLHRMYKFQNSRTT